MASSTAASFSSTRSRVDPKALRARYDAMPQRGRIIAEYVWIDGTGLSLRSKSRTLDAPVSSAADLPEWNFDGSSTMQAPGEDSEVILKPQAVFHDPFRGGDNILVMCDCYKPDGTPLEGNTRAKAAAVFDRCKDEKCWFGLEQEYVLMDPEKRWPLGWPEGGYPRPQGPYYCSVGATNNFGRDIVDAHYRACLAAGVTISGVNAEVLPSQFEFQVGPCEGLDCGDHMWMARYLMHRVCEDFGVDVSFDPKPCGPEWSGSGCHVNFSTAAIRAEGGYKVLLEAIERLGRRHDEHIVVYGDGNDRRLTGMHETASIKNFSYGVANRGASIRIPRTTERDGKGYLEDRRPAANIDPYVVSARIAQTVCLGE